MSHYATFNINIEHKAPPEVVKAFVAELLDCYPDGNVEADTDSVYVDIGGETYSAAERADSAIQEFVRDHATDWCILTGERGAERYEEILTPKSMTQEQAEALHAADNIREEWKALTPTLRCELIEELLTDDDVRQLAERATHRAAA